MAYLRNKKDSKWISSQPKFELQGIQNVHHRYLVLNSTKNIRFTFKATAYAGDKGKMHSICSTPEVSKRREIFAMGLKLTLHHYQMRFSQLVRQKQLEKMLVVVLLCLVITRG